MKKLVLSVWILMTGSALASPSSPKSVEAPSRALQQAKRVAEMENEGDLPSRAMWLGQRAAKHFKIAMENKGSGQSKKKNTPSPN